MKSADSLTAWDWYQRGIWHLYQDTEADNAAALRDLGRAIELNPNFAPAFAASAEVLCQDIISGHRALADATIEEAFRLAERAVALDDRDAMAHMVLGRIDLLRCKHADSVAELETAVALNPSYADAYHALGFSLIFSGRPEDALPQFETAIRLSPYDPSISSFYEMQAWAFLVLGRYEEAAKSARLSVRRPNAQPWAYATLCAALGHLGQSDEAAVVREELLKRKPDFSISFIRRFVYYNKNPDHLERYIEGMRKAGLE